MASSPLEHLTELMRDPSLPVSVEWVDEMARLRSEEHTSELQSPR